MQFDQERNERLTDNQERDNGELLANDETRAGGKHTGTTAGREMNEPGLAGREMNESGLAGRTEPAPGAGQATAPRTGAEQADRVAPRTDAGQPDRAAPRNGDGEFAVDLFDHDELEKFRGDWREVQNRFVDDPQAAVRQADRLVADVMRSLSATFADHKQELEREWQHGSPSETEDLRQALRHYRTYFNRLLNT